MQNAKRNIKTTIHVIALNTSLNKYLLLLDNILPK